MRVGFRTLASLALCAGAAGAAMSHFVIDVVGDYALARDSYDHLAHGSRELMSVSAMIVAAVLAARGLRVCCDVATRNRGRIERPALRPHELLGILWGAAATSIVAVPAMECLDGRLAGAPVQRLADAFGGSIPLGLGTTIACAAVVALVVYSIARWLISHRDSIATIIETLLRRTTDPADSCGYGRNAHRFTPRRRCTAQAPRFSKRGPPAISFA
ncbi:MAG: hypothetical protein JO104_04755 [Candidatus Eremiobacteraeota bacterium]|nr:hypothetical protein [Candidatus Eremiobacteraeota bacterium]